MTRFFVGVVVVALLETVAGADGTDPNSISIASFDPDNAVAPISTVEGPGIKIGEGTVLHPIFGLETGYDSNVFYESTNPHGAALLRLLAQIGTGSLPNARLAGGEEQPTDLGSFQYRADLRASYDLVLSGNDAVSGTGGLGLGASLHGLANPMGRWSFGIDEDFVRLIRAANFETDANTDRDINNLQLKLVYHPSDSAFGGFLYYNNTIDVFERAQQNFADRMFNRIGVHPTWQWLPQTQVYLDVSEALVTGISSSTDVVKKVNSYPFTALAGLATLFTLKTTFNVFAGYTNGFYSSGPSFSAPVLGAAVGYRYSPLGRITAQYMLQYQDSINANYYRDHIIQVSLQQIVAPFLFMVQPEIHFREYTGVDVVQGSPVRDDVIYMLVAGVHYTLKSRFEATLDYRFSAVQTDYRYQPLGGGVTDDPSYVRHEVLLGVRVAL
jgi:hypothetical protein